MAFTVIRCMALAAPLVVLGGCEATKEVGEAQKLADSVHDCRDYGQMVAARTCDRFSGQAADDGYNRIVTMLDQILEKRWSAECAADGAAIRALSQRVGQETMRVRLAAGNGKVDRCDTIVDKEAAAFPALAVTTKR